MDKFKVYILSIIIGFWALSVNAQKPVSKVNTYAVVVGISDYACESDLNLCTADAMAMANLFESVYHAKVKLLLNQDATTDKDRKSVV